MQKWLITKMVTTFNATTMKHVACTFKWENIVNGVRGAHLVGLKNSLEFLALQKCVSDRIINFLSKRNVARLNNADTPQKLYIYSCGNYVKSMRKI